MNTNTPPGCQSRHLSAMSVRVRACARFRQRRVRSWLAISGSLRWRQSRSVLPLCLSFREQIPTLTRLSSAWQSASSSLPAIGRTSSNNRQLKRAGPPPTALRCCLVSNQTPFDHHRASNVARDIKVDGLWHAVHNGKKKKKKKGGEESKVCYNLLAKKKTHFK